MRDWTTGGEARGLHLEVTGPMAVWSRGSKATSDNNHLGHFPTEGED